MNDEGRVSSLRVGRLSRGLVVVEMALSFGPLVMAGLTIQSITNVNRADFGFAMADVWSARLTLPDEDYPDDDPNLPLFNIATVEERFDAGAWPFRVFGSLFMAFGIAALFLATIGLYGVMAFSVSGRTLEFGVRMAIGASAGDVVRMVLRQGLAQVIIGIALGVGLGIALGSALSLLLFRVRPYDPVVLAGVGAVLASTALVACFVPARRASRVDPITRATRAVARCPEPLRPEPLTPCPALPYYQKSMFVATLTRTTTITMAMRVTTTRAGEVLAN